MGKANGVREVGYFDCEGGGQIVVDGNYAYIGHVDKTTGTTIVDVSDPKKPRQVANVPTALSRSSIPGRSCARTQRACHSSVSDGSPSGGTAAHVQRHVLQSSLHE